MLMGAVPSAPGIPPPNWADIGGLGGDPFNAPQQLHGSGTWGVSISNVSGGGSLLVKKGVSTIQTINYTDVGGSGSFSGTFGDAIHFEVVPSDAQVGSFCTVAVTYFAFSDTFEVAVMGGP